MKMPPAVLIVGLLIVSAAFNINLSKSLKRERQANDSLRAKLDLSRSKDLIVLGGDPPYGYIVTSGSHVLITGINDEHDCTLSIRRDGSLSSMFYCSIDGERTEDTFNPKDKQ
jgi:hypothetical protein